MTKKLKETYGANPSAWIAVAKCSDLGWKIVHNSQSWSKSCDWEIISIKHKEILEAYLADDKVEIEFYLPYVMCTDGTELEATWEVDDNFIEHYNPELTYRLKETPMKWNGYYIKASQETYDKLVSEGYKAKSRDTIRYIFFEVDNDKLYGKDYLEDMDTDKQFYLVNGEFTEEKEDEYDTADTIYNRTTNMVSNETINSFTAHGFEVPDFEGEILKEVKGKYIGWNSPDGNGMKTVAFAQEWTNEGKALLNGSRYNLTPIKKEWYEYPENFPALLVWDSGIDAPSYRSTISKDSFIKLHRQGWKLATKEEVNSLYCKEIK